MTMNMMKGIMTLEFAVGVETGSLLLCYNSYGERVNFGSACGGNDEVRFLISTFSNFTLRCLFGSDNTLISSSVFCDAGGGLGCWWVRWGPTKPPEHLTSFTPPPSSQRSVHTPSTTPIIREFSKMLVSK